MKNIKSELWGPCNYPIAPGHEIVAEVSAVGEDVKDFKKEDLVGFGTIRDICHKCKYCKDGREELCEDEEETLYLWNSLGMICQSFTTSC
jgi:uncharacterized zinc-type alcohol dehydrogenase-like protein